MSNIEVPPVLTEEHSSMLLGDLEESEAHGESATDWWSRAHDKRHTFWLSGTDGPEVWSRLGVDERLVVGAAVLNVGVGMGHCTRQLAERGCKVSVLDISAQALTSVADVSTGYLASDLERLPTGCFDVALSHLVAQHMNDADLEAQVRHVVRSLKPGGVFAVQYAAGGGGAKPGDEDDRILKAGAVRRTREGFEALVERAGGASVQILEREVHACGTEWLVAHIAPPSIIRRSWLSRLFASVNA